MLNERIKTLRDAYRINQKDLADALHVSKQTVSNWENDNVVPSIEMLVKMTEFFHVSADYLLGLDNRIYLEITGLSLEKASLIQQIVDNLKKAGKSS